METLTITHRGRTARFPDTQGHQALYHTAGVFYESAMLDAIADLARPGVYVDVGANIGNHSAYFEMFCPASTVIAFEPLSSAYRVLQQVREINGLGFESHQLGLGRERDHITHTIFDHDYSFDVATLDEFNLIDVAVVKIDIEGMEVPALEGMRETLASSRPHLYIEAHTDAEVDAHAAVLAPMGYKRTGRVFNSSPTYEWAPSKRSLRRNTRHKGSP